MPCLKSHYVATVVLHHLFLFLPAAAQGEFSKLGMSQNCKYRSIVYCAHIAESTRELIFEPRAWFYIAEPWSKNVTKTFAMGHSRGRFAHRGLTAFAKRVKGIVSRDWGRL
jgi:hypothetical protein